MRQGHGRAIFCTAMALYACVYTKPDQPQCNSDIPEWAVHLFAAKGMKEFYDLGAGIDGCVLRGDFNGDRREDMAAMIKEKRSGKSGIAIFHGGTEEVTLFGAGRNVRSGCLILCDDLVWIDDWYVHPKEMRIEMGIDESDLPMLQGDALFLKREETRSDLLFWDGREYQWYFLED